MQMKAVIFKFTRFQQIQIWQSEILLLSEEEVPKSNKNSLFATQILNYIN